VFDIYTIIFLALAVFIFLRLRSVLGQRTGSERSPYDVAPTKDAGPAGKSNVVPIPGLGAPPAAAPLTDVPAADRWKGFAEPETVAAKGLDAIAAATPGFNIAHFIDGARSAYEMIVLAFAQGDRRTLRDLLSPEVLEGFEAAIRGRETRGEAMETRFVSIDKASLENAEVKGRTAQITLRFVSQIVSATRDKAGNVVDGNADQVTDVTDVWTFARDTSSRDPNWKLVATEAGQ
jgi:predicted lipid-binding transport protein (Tim44 family)